MDDGARRDEADRDNRFSYLARYVLNRISTSEDPSAEDTSRQQDKIVAGLCDAAMAIEAEKVSSFALRLVSSGSTPEDILDTLIPAAARRLGEMWHEDHLSFTDVTLATARLQSLAREYAGPIEPPLHPLARVLLICPAWETHTLGSIVATGQLRRHGVAVTLAMGPGPRELEALLDASGLDLVMISLGNSEMISEVWQLVRRIRGLTGGRIPVALGGSLLMVSQVPKELESLCTCDTDPLRILQRVLAPNNDPSTPVEQRQSAP